MPIIAKIGTEVAIAIITTVAATAVVKGAETIWKLRRRPKVTVVTN